MGNRSLRLSLRKPDPLTGFSPSALASTADDLRALKERAAIIQQRIERELQKKKEIDLWFEDHSDNPFIPFVPGNGGRCWRGVESIPGGGSGGGGFGFAGGWQAPVGHGSGGNGNGGRSYYRRRVGRGGRVMLDRIHPSSSFGSTRGIITSPSTSSESESEEIIEDPNMIARRRERHLFDSDALNEFPSFTPTIVDDFSILYMIRRSTLLRPADVESLTINSSYIEESYRYVSMEKERVEPPLIVGRLIPPTTTSLPISSTGSSQSAGGGGGRNMPTQLGGPGGVPIGSQSAAAISQIMVAATQAHRLAQQQAHLKRSNLGATTATPPPTTNLGAGTGFQIGSTAGTFVGRGTGNGVGGGRPGSAGSGGSPITNKRTLLPPPPSTTTSTGVGKPVPFNPFTQN